MPRGTADKEVIEIEDNGHSESNGLRERRKIDRNDISRRDFNNTIGGSGYDQNDTNDTNTVASGQNSNTAHRRKEIRRRLKHKHNHVAPKVRWTKFMHSETKNREFRLSKTNCGG